MEAKEVPVAAEMDAAEETEGVQIVQKACLSCLSARVVGIQQLCVAIQNLLNERRLAEISDRTDVLSTLSYRDSLIPLHAEIRKPVCCAGCCARFSCTSTRRGTPGSPPRGRGLRAP